jgi:hypothetical protein
LTHGRADYLDYVLPKKRRPSEVSASKKNGSLMPSAGTISIWKSTLVRITGASRVGVLDMRAVTALMPGFWRESQSC